MVFPAHLAADADGDVCRAEAHLRIVNDVDRCVGGTARLHMHSPGHHWVIAAKVIEVACGSESELENSG